MPDEPQMPADPVSDVTAGWITMVAMLRGLVEGGATLEEAAAIIAALVKANGQPPA